MPSDNKLKQLESIVRGYGSCLVAFSGGVDSTFLLKASAQALPREKLLAVTAVSATYPADELAFAKKMCKALGVRHLVIKTRELSDKRFTSNPVQRCFFCKDELFGRLKKIAAKESLKAVLDASTVSDKDDFRPGNRAKRKWRIKSPLIEAGLCKDRIRSISKRWRLPSWNKPAQACLASRIPYGRSISAKVLSRLGRAEQFLRGMGFVQVRVRDYGDTCRIEVEPKKIKALIAKREAIRRCLRGLGYRYITVDLEGYRSGSLNEVLDKKCAKR